MKTILRIIIGIVLTAVGLWLGYLTMVASADVWLRVVVFFTAFCFVLVGIVMVAFPKHIKEVIEILTLYP